MPIVPSHAVFNLPLELNEIDFLIDLVNETIKDSDFPEFFIMIGNNCRIHIDLFNVIVSSPFGVEFKCSMTNIMRNEMFAAIEKLTR